MNANRDNAAKNWVWTLNNPTEAELVQIKALTFGTQVKYLTFGYEVGEEGTRHLQGYLELVKKLRISCVKKLGGLTRAHFELRRGTQKQAIDYCHKDGDFCVFGMPQTQSGKGLSEKQNLMQEQLALLAQELRDGKREREVYEQQPLISAMYPKYIAKVISWVKPNIREDLRVELHYGSTGAGKTHDAFKRYPDLYSLPVKSNKTMWFPGYDGEKVVLIDDFKGNFGLTELLRLLDKFPIQVETKGGFVWFTPEVIIITSNFKEREWYKDWENREEHYLALMRRIHKRYQWNSRRKWECDSEWKPLASIFVPSQMLKADDDEIVIPDTPPGKYQDEFSQEMDINLSFSTDDERPEENAQYEIQPPNFKKFQEYAKGRKPPPIIIDEELEKDILECINKK